MTENRWIDKLIGNALDNQIDDYPDRLAEMQRVLEAKQLRDKHRVMIQMVISMERDALIKVVAELMGIDLTGYGHLFPSAPPFE